MRIRRIATIASFMGIDIWAIWMFVSTLHSGPRKVLGNLEIHPPFFLLLACIAVVFSIVLPINFCWDAVRLWRPKNKFRALEDDIHHLRNGVEYTLEVSNDPQKPRISPDLRTTLLTVTHKLDRLGIQYPKLNDLEQWWRVLPFFEAWARVGNLKRARSYRYVSTKWPTGA